MIQPHPNFQKRILVSPIKKTKTGFTDLHMHSLLSDGALPPVQLVKIAAARGLKSIAITDHDNIDSYDIALQTAKELNVELISGIEISAVHNGKDIHILGYFCDVTNLALHMELQEQAKRRLNRVRAIIRKLNLLGVDVNYDKIITYCTGKVIGRPHIANALIAEEYVTNFNEAFNKYLGENGAAFVEKKGISPQQTIKLIENAGGIAVMAHPMKTNADYLIEDMVEWGLKGIETYCHGQKGNKGKRYREMVRKYGLVGTGGSDFHNDQSQLSIGGAKVPEMVVDLLKQAREKQKDHWF